MFGKLQGLTDVELMCIMCEFGEDKMKMEELYHKSFRILKRKMIAVPSTLEFSAFHGTAFSPYNIKGGRVYDAKMSLYGSLLATRKRDMDLNKHGPTRLVAFVKGKPIEMFPLRLKGAFEFFMPLSGDVRLTRNYTFEKTIRAIAEDAYPQFCERFQFDPSEEVAKQRYLEYLSEVDALEIGKNSDNVYSNEAGIVQRFSNDAHYESCTAVMYRFKAQNEGLKDVVCKRINTIIRREGLDAPAPTMASEQIEIKI